MKVIIEILENLYDHIITPSNNTLRSWTNEIIGYAFERQRHLRRPSSELREVLSLNDRVILSKYECRASYLSHLKLERALRKRE